jgi:hypothetical protein
MVRIEEPRDAPFHTRAEMKEAGRMGNTYNLCSWSKQYSEEALGEASMLHLLRQARIQGSSHNGQGRYSETLTAKLSRLMGQEGSFLTQEGASE